MKLRYLGLFAFIFILPCWGGHGEACAQKDDVGLWLGADVTKKLNKKWNVGASLEYRMRDNISTTDRFSAGVSIGYKPKKWLKAQAGYDYLHSRNAGGYNSSGDKYRSTYWYPRQRVYAGVTGLWKMSKRFRLSLRERWVYTYRPSYSVNRMNVDASSTNYGQITQKDVASHAENVLRSKLTLSYNVKKYPLNPFASVELYNSWNVEKVRYSIGADYDINKHNAITAYYLFQDYKTEGDVDQHVFGLNYSYTF